MSTDRAWNEWGEKDPYFGVLTDDKFRRRNLTDEAKAFVTGRASDDTHRESRFPAFWDSFHDWLPDIDHGGVLQLALQKDPKLAVTEKGW